MERPETSTAGRHAPARSLSPRAVPTLSVEALRLHLDTRNLVTTGKRPQLISRLLKSVQQSHAANPSNDDANQETPSGSEASRGQRSPTDSDSADERRSASSDRGSGHPDSEVDSDLDSDSTYHAPPPKRSKTAVGDSREGASSRGTGTSRARKAKRSASQSGKHPGSSSRQDHRSNPSTSSRARHLASSRYRSPEFTPSETARRHHRQRSRSCSSQSTSSVAARWRHRQSSRSCSSESTSSVAARRRHRRHSSSSSSFASSSSHNTRTSSSASIESHRHRSRSRDRHQGRHQGRHRGHRRHHGHRHHHHRHYHGKSYSSTPHWSEEAGVSCVPPLPRRWQRRIHRGEYVNFDRLLPPGNSPPFAAARQQRHRHQSSDRTVRDCGTWLQAWNRYLCTRVAYDPTMALELVKYQTLVCMLFTHYAPLACVEYDRLFRQAAAQDTSIRWDCLKEDIFVWALTLPSHTHPAKPGLTTLTAQLSPQPFRATAQLSPQPFRAPPRAQPFRDVGSAKERPTAPRAGSMFEQRISRDLTGAEICRRYNMGGCKRDDQCKYAHSCWVPGCNGSHPGTECPRRAW